MPGVAGVLTKGQLVDSQKLMNLAIAGGIIFAAWKLGSPMVKGAAVSVAAVIVAKQIPYVKDYV
jgi:hypothetical protein